MALIKCPECGREISDQAVSCPNCGLPLKRMKNKESKLSIPSNVKAPLILLFIISGLLFVRMISVFIISTNEEPKLESLAEQSAEEYYKKCHSENYKSLWIPPQAGISYPTESEKWDHPGVESLNIPPFDDYLRDGDPESIIESLKESIIPKIYYREVAYILFILSTIGLMIEVFVLHRYDRKILTVVHFSYLITVLVDILMTVQISVAIKNSSLLMMLKDYSTNGVKWSDILGLKFDESSFTIGIILGIISVIVFILACIFNRKRMRDQTK